MSDALCMKDDFPTEQAKTPPRVTVLMAVYNGEAFLREAVESILTQTYRDFEFLVIDDGSTDDSRAIVASYDDPRIRIIDNPHNIGLTRSLNRGLAIARGELIARQDADDVSHPQRIERQVSFMELHPEIAMVGCQARLIRQHGKPRISRLLRKATTLAGIRYQFLHTNPFIHTSVLFRRKIVWDTLGGYNEDFKTSQDFELWSRLLARYRAANLSEMLVDNRWHPQSISANYSPASICPVKDVFENNLKSVFGHTHDYKRWPAIWTNVTNPTLRAFVSPREVFGHMQSIYKTFPREGLEQIDLAELRLLYAMQLLTAALLIAPRAGWLAIGFACRALFLCPGLGLRELPNTLPRILFSRFQKSAGRPTSPPELSGGDKSQ